MPTWFLYFLVNAVFSFHCEFGDAFNKPVERKTLVLRGSYNIIR